MSLCDNTEAEKSKAFKKEVLNWKRNWNGLKLPVKVVNFCIKKKKTQLFRNGFQAEDMSLLNVWEICI